MAIIDNTEKINELIAAINSLPVAGSGSSGSNGKDGFSPTILVESVDGGHNIIITDVNGIQSFFVPDGKDGEDGKDGLPGSGGSDGAGIVSIEQTTTSTESGGTNIITATLSNGQVSTFNIKNGAKGSAGANGNDGADGSDGVGIVSIEQTTTSPDDSGNNVVTVILSDGTVSTFKVKNGSKGSVGANGANGANATINGVNSLTLNTTNGITKSQSGSTMTIGASLTDILASGPIILKEGVGYHYGDTLPAAGTKGRLFFKKVT